MSADTKRMINRVANHDGEKGRVPPDIEPLVVGQEDLAKLLAVDETTIWRWDKAGEIGPVSIKIVGRRVWVLAEIKEWVAAHMPNREAWLALKETRE
jgi:predicted DNA-binding transcriptional regulator AlpA